jgi:hypothetical protein
MSDDNQAIIYENMRKVLEEFFEKSHLMKSLEEQLAGKLTQENQCLKQKLETLLQENELLREEVKLLAGPAELETKDNTILLLRGELKSQQEKHQKENESIQQVLMENANNLKELSSEKTNIEIQIKALNSTIREKERALADLNELHNQEIERVKSEAEEQRKQTEKENLKIAEAWSKKVEELKKPWWKF